MKSYEDIPLEVKTYSECKPTWGQSFPVPRGWEYRTDSYLTYRTAERDLSFDLCLAGDRLEIVSKTENRRIRYEITE